MNEQPLHPRRSRWWVPVLGLTMIGLFAGGAVTLTEYLTRDRIAGNQALQTLRQLNQVLPPELYDNQPHLDRALIEAPRRAFGSREPVAIYRARRNGQPVAAVLTVIAPNGYNGRIRMLVGVQTDGRILGVRVTDHRETPGIGDPIEAEKSDWIFGFDGLSIGNPPENRWSIARDGGAIDEISGATFTSRTIVSAIRRALLYFGENQQEIFAAPAAPGPPETDFDP